MEKEQTTELVNKLIAGVDSEAAAASLFEAYKDKIYYYLTQYIQNEVDIDDVIQDAFISAFDSISTLEKPENFKAWLWRISYFKAMDYLRLKKRSPILFTEENESLLENIEDDNREFLPGDIMETEETKMFVSNLIKSLPEDQKTAILFYYYQQMSVAEIAAMLSVSEGTIKSRLNYARKTIKARIEEYRKKGYTVTAVLPIPLLTRLLLAEAEHTTLSITATTAIWGSISSSLGISAKAAAAGTAGAAAAATNKAAGLALSAKVIAAISGIAAIAAITAVVVFTQPKPEQAEDTSVALTQEDSQSDRLEASETEASISLNLDPQTQSEYAQLYYQFIQDYIKEAYPSGDSSGQVFTDAEMVDFDMDGEYELIVLRISQPRANFEVAHISTYYKEDVVNTYKNNELAESTHGIGFGAEINYNLYLTEYQGRPALVRKYLGSGVGESILNWLDDERNLMVTIIESIENFEEGGHDFSLEEGPEGAVQLYGRQPELIHINRSSEAESAYYDSQSQISTWGVKASRQNEEGVVLYYDIEVEATYGERLKEYFE